jgi:hypothetical protein
MMRDLTPAERKAIRDLEDLADRWPPSLMLFAGDGNDIEVLLTLDYLADPHSAVAITKIGRIPNDGGGR